MPPHPARALLDAPISDLTNLLIKQFVRLLREHEVTLTTPNIDAIAQATETRQALPLLGKAMIAPLGAIIAESEADLQARFHLNFTQALATDMNGIGGWETTAEFLELANHKSNAELRISAGAALLLLLGDMRYAHHALAVIADDAGVMDVDAMLARRALCHFAQVDPLRDDWLTTAAMLIG